MEEKQMSTTYRATILMLAMLCGIVTGAFDSLAGPIQGQKAPVFSLKDAKDQVHDLSRVATRPMTVLYFFDAESKSNRAGLATLEDLVRRYKGADLNVWAITASPKEKVAAALAGSSFAFPVLLDTSRVSTLYGAQDVLPTVCILGPELQVLDYFQGGGKVMEVMLVRVAEGELQQRQTQIAMAMSDEIIKKDPQNVEAKAVKGHAALRSGEVDKAKQVFEDMAAKSGSAEIVGKEGLAAVYARKGESEKALKLAREVEQKAPDRSFPNVIKGEVLYSQNKPSEARSEYEKAVTKKQAAPYQKAVGYNQLGRMYAKNGETQAARQLYDQAVAIDPYYIEGTTNKGLTYEKEGKWDKALDSYRKAMEVEKSDLFATALARKAQEMVDVQNDVKRKERMDRLVKELVERFRTQKKSVSKDEDTWTSRPMVLSFVDFQEKGMLNERDGFASVMTIQLTDLLNNSNRVQVVERVLMERVIEELHLGSSELADPETALKLGKVLACKLIGTGSVQFLPGMTLLSLRLIDSETSSIPIIINKEIGAPASIEKEINTLNREILKSVISKYPLRGYVAKISGDRAVINIGARQGVVLGTKFSVLQEGEVIEYKGKKLRSSDKPLGEIEVVQVEPDLCHARIVGGQGAVKVDVKVQEKLDGAV
jgi:tetratricopeptide (TPR) repeat protein